MRTVALILTFSAAVFAAPKFEPLFQDYHEKVGIPHYEAIKAFENALDFDGTRITGGSHAVVGQYPFMVGVMIQLTERDSVCGSSLLTNTRSLTAAHCWRYFNSVARSFTLVFGSDRLNGGTRVSTNQVEMHPHYNQQNLNNDIAVILHNHVNFGRNINRINLASGSNLFEGYHANVVGFGRLGDSGAIPHNQPLSHVSVKIISNAECSRVFRADVIIHSTICTSGAGYRGPCVGDSGGPLAIGNVLIGVVSFTSAFGCTYGYPAGYQRVSAFNSWIRTHL